MNSPTSGFASNEATDMLALSARIADELIAKIRWAERIPFWTGLARSPKSGLVKARVLDATLYEGSGGIGLFLGELYKQTGLEDYASVVRGCRRAVALDMDDGQDLGAYSGEMGRVYADLRMADALGEMPAPFVSRTLSKVSSSLGTVESPDIINGFAGILLVALAAGKTPSLEDVSLDLARSCAAALIQHAHAGPHGTFWSLPNLETPLTGFSHGTAGIAAALATYSAVSGDTAALPVISGALEFEDSKFDASTCSWLDCRPDIPPQFSWCHGAPGIVLARTRICELGLGQLVSPAPDQITRDIVRRSLERSHCLCHGAMGNASILNAISPDDALAIARSAIGQYVKEGRWRGGLGGYYECLGLMTGSAGVGLALYEMATDRRPSALLLDR